MRAIDTNVLVRLLVGDDLVQTAAAERFVQLGAWVSLVVLSETIWVLRSRYRKLDADQAFAVRALLTHGNITIENAEVVSAALDRFQRVAGLGFTDCLVLELAHKAGHLPLGTFDQRLSREPDAVLPG